MNGPDRFPTASPDPRLPGPSALPVEAPNCWARPSKIQPWHLERLVIVYVRQSSHYQVMFNRESAEVQSGFRQLAIDWGWPSSRILVIDDDQAQSGTSTEGRSGFQRLLTEVNLNHVGIILGFRSVGCRAPTPLVPSPGAVRHLPHSAGGHGRRL